MKIKEAGEDRLFILADEQTDLKTKSGIVIETNTDSLEYRTGTIRAAGQGLFHPGVMEQMPVIYSIGDKVLYEPRQMLEVTIEGEKLHVIRTANVIASLEDE